MSTEKQRIAYELAMEYCRQNRIFSHTPEQIPKMAGQFEEIWSAFYTAIKGSDTFKGLL